MKIKTIGIPEAMYYYEFGPIWIRFFEALGLRPVLSGKTDGEILAAGIRRAASDLCLPVKAMFGHTERLLEFPEKPDCIFLPKIYYTYGKCYTCPKTIGLTDMLKVSFKNMLPIIEPEFYGDMKDFLIRTGKMLGFGRRKALLAYQKAEKNCRAGEFPSEEKGLTVALIGHSYVVNDDYLNMDIRKKLKNMDVNYITSDALPLKTLCALAGNTDYKTPFWHSANKNLGFTKHVIESHRADGFIFLNSFGCGTDSLSVSFCRDFAKRNSDIPAITVSLDEHSAEAGFITRLEAFTDCIAAAKAKSKKEAI